MMYLDPAVLLSLRGRDRPTQHYVITLPESNQEGDMLRLFNNCARD